MLGFKFKKRNTIKQEEYLEKQAKKFPKVLFYIFLVYFVIFAIYIGSYVYFINTYELCKVTGASMKNTLNPHISDNDGKTCDDLVYINIDKQVERFDIFVVKDPDPEPSSEDKEDLIIKRAIGMPGDLVTIKKDEHGYYYVYYANAETNEISKLEEDYVESYASWAELSQIDVGGVSYQAQFYDKFIGSGNYTVKTIDGVSFLEVPENHIFFLGDNRRWSADSRKKGLANVSEIKGVAEIILHNAGKENANVFKIKVSAIFSHIWKNLTNFFAR